MPLSKKAIIEIQEAAKWNFKKRVREAEEKKAQEEAIKKAVEESNAPKPAKKKKIVAEKESK